MFINTLHYYNVL